MSGRDLGRSGAHRSTQRASRALAAGSVLALLSTVAVSLAHVRGFDLAAIARAAAQVEGPYAVLAAAIGAAIVVARLTAGSRPPLRSMIVGVVEAAYARPGQGLWAGVQRRAAAVSQGTVTSRAAPSRRG